jgi:hypothetical protein
MSDGKLADDLALRIREVEIKAEELALKKNEFEYKKKQDQSQPPGSLTTFVAFLALVVTGGQLAVAYYTYESSNRKNNSDMEKTRQDVAKILHDMHKDDTDVAVQVARLLLEHPSLFKDKAWRGLGTSIATALNVPFKQQILAEIQKQSPEAERTERAKDPEVATALAALKVTIHYKSPKDTPKVLEALRQLRAKNWVAYAELEESSSVAQHLVYFKNQNQTDAESLRDTVLSAVGITDKQRLPLKPRDDRNSFFGVWLDPLP